MLNDGAKKPIYDASKDLDAKPYVKLTEYVKRKGSKMKEDLGDLAFSWRQPLPSSIDVTFMPGTQVLTVSQRLRNMCLSILVDEVYYEESPLS